MLRTGRVDMKLVEMCLLDIIQLALNSKVVRYKRVIRSD